MNQSKIALQVSVDRPDVKRNIHQVLIFVSEDKVALILKDYRDVLKSQSWKDHIPTVLTLWITISSVAAYKDVYGIPAATIEAGMHLGLVLVSLWTSSKFITWLKNRQQVRLETVIRRLENELSISGNQSGRVLAILKEIYGRISTRKATNEEVPEGGGGGGKKSD